MAKKSDIKEGESLETLTVPDPLELMGVEFKRVAIIGVGLIGGSIGLRMKAMNYPGIIVGYDQPDVLDEALMRDAIDQGAGDLSEAVLGADLVVIAVPVDEAVNLLPTILKTAKTGAVVTDTAPAKVDLIRAAKETAKARGVYIGGHPLAGSRRQGVAGAVSELFVGAYYLICPPDNVSPEVIESLRWWVRMLGAYPLTLNAELHDRIIAITSHVPFVLALALSDWVARQSERTEHLMKLTTGHFQTITSLASLPLTAWEAALTINRERVLEELAEFRKVLEKAETELRAGRLQDLWQKAHAFQRRLSRERPGDWTSQCELVIATADRPGYIARISSLLASHDINICDIGVVHSREGVGGSLRIVLESHVTARKARDLLIQNGFGVWFR